MNSHKLTNLITAVAEATHAAGEMLCAYFQRIESKQILAKSSPVDLVSNADREAEALLQERLGSLIPDAGFIGEESAAHAGSCGYSWVVDPLDGTSNYLAGVPIWSVSVALCDDTNTPLLGIVHAPLLGRTWQAVSGEGAWLGAVGSGRRLAVRVQPPGGGLHNAMLATGFPYDLSSEPGQRNIGLFCHMQSTFHKIRRLGSAAIDLAFVADGTFDGMWELALSAWDTAAGTLLVTEAGGITQRINGESYTLGAPDLLAAATPELAAVMRLNLRSVAGCPLSSSHS